MKTNRSALAAWLTALALAVGAQAAGLEGSAAPPSPAEARLKSDVSYLADDGREGRAPGTAGIEAAADYIATVFKEAGLKPAKGLNGYFQPFEITGAPRLAGTPSLAFQAPGDTAIKVDSKTDFAPLAIGTAGKLDAAPVAFAGYGITAKDKELSLDYDDYADFDAKGKVVLIIRREPQVDKEDSPFSGKQHTSYATFRHKVSNAFQHGAAAVLLVNDATTTKEGQKDELLRFDSAGPDRISELPVVMITRELADRVLAAAGQPALKDLEAQIDSDLKPRSRVLPDVKASLDVSVNRTPITTKNVVGVLEGAGPLADETVVVGAHYDHLGHGGAGSLALLSSAIHNGADDNASGTALVMELARRLARRQDPLPRRVVFVAFSGEERGLLGSAHYVESPPYPLDKTVAMVNFDMVGRLNDKNELTIYGTGTSPGFDTIVDALGKAEGFAVKKIADGRGPSDQQSFYRKNIPVLFTFTGTHKDYHRPSDDVALINFAGMSRIADLGEILLLDLARRPERPSFTRVSSPRPERDGERLALRVYLGTIPDYGSSSDEKGVKLAGVREGSPAEKGGLKEGDFIVGMGGKPIGTMDDYMELLSRYKPGDKAEVLVKRAGKETTLTVTFEARPAAP